MNWRYTVNLFLSKLETPTSTFNTIDISRSAILNNFNQFKPHHPWPVLKSNAYGHGLKPIISILKENRFTYYVADSYYEALQIWQYHRHPVLIIGSVPPANLALMDFSELALTVQDSTTLKVLIRLKKPVTIHLKVNTGMNRQGIDPADLDYYLRQIKNHPHLRLDGVYSHLADADNPKSTLTAKQIKLFSQIKHQVRASGLNPPYFHLAATDGSRRLPAGLTNAIRLGIGLYRSSLRLTSTLVNVRQLQKGDPVSYNRTFTAKSNFYSGIIPVGYFEGLDRRLSNRGFIKYQNKYYPIAGRICMNLSVINFKATQPKLFDQVEVIGFSGKNSIDSMAKIANTIPYEILVHLNHSIRRRLVE